MSLVDPERLTRAVEARLSKGEAALSKLHSLGASGFRAVVDGEECLTNVHVWPDGSGFVEYLYVASETGQNAEVHLVSEAEAVEWATKQIKEALARAGGQR